MERNPTPKDMPQRKLKAVVIDELGFPSGRAHIEIIERTTCECEGCLSIFPRNKKGIQEALSRYTEINVKVRQSNMEAGKTIFQEAEEILKK